MKFYETHYEDYLNSLKVYNLHPELEPVFNKFPQSISQLSHLIFYGPSGVGKYTQVLNAIQRYSSSGLGHDKKINIQSEKYDYTYHISDIHYEIDMALLGCNSKMIWHDIIQQIVDIVAVKPVANQPEHKTAIVVCKNFHMIHSELLEIFYSYMQEYSSRFSIVHLKFIIISEHLCFIPNNILSCCQTINIRRPSKDLYINMINAMKSQRQRQPRKLLYKDDANSDSQQIDDSEYFRIMLESRYNAANSNTNIVEENEILNLKELYYMTRIKTAEEIPNDIFNTVCDTIIQMMLTPNKLVHTEFRDAIYDIFVYNLDIPECMWYILCNLIEYNHLRGEAISDVMTKSYNFFKYFNNNYRPIYHLESILHYIIIKINGYSTDV